MSTHIHPEGKMSGNINIDSVNDISEEFLMMLLMQAGMGESLSKEAMIAAKSGDFEKSDQLMTQADEAFKEVHKSQTALIGFDEGAGKVPMTLILTHIQDHIMVGMLAKEIIQELILIRRELAELKDTMKSFK